MRFTVNNKRVTVAIYFTLIVMTVLALSFMSVRLWGEKSESPADLGTLFYESNMTVAQFAKSNGLERRELKDLLGLHSIADLERPLTDFSPNPQELIDKLHENHVKQGENARKNWNKIYAKFILWAAFLGIMFWVLRTNRITARNRRIFYLCSLSLFGVVLGSDPSPMGTVKDTIALYGIEGVIFGPRLIALSIFLLMVILANKFICGWGCQFGALQDFIFRINRNSKDRKGLIRQFKPPFWISNSVRILFFTLFAGIAYIVEVDLIEPIDPFKMFRPVAIGLFGGLFLIVILFTSLFVYRPWCHFFCPFGLVGWFFEKLSFSKIAVDYSRCKTGCVVCEKACPSDCMGTILKQDRTIPDCFSCGTCIEACPTKAISLHIGSRAKPPEGKFKE